MNRTDQPAPWDDEIQTQADGMNTSSIDWISTGSHGLAQETVAVVLAGGMGTRLGALTQHDCKPALPFGGRYRNIDFSLSNCVNSGIHHIGVATQYKEASLLRHLARVWPATADHGAGCVEPWRAEGRAVNGSYCGTADAVYQNWSRIDALDPRLVLVLAGDHVYKMDYRPMLRHHAAHGADITVGCVEVAVEEAREFGVMSIDSADRIVRFAEKPRHPECLPGRPDRALGSMGIYVFNRVLLGRLLREDALAETSSHDFGRDLLPQLIDKVKVYAYPFTPDAAVGGGYWRDVGTISAYWHAHMELLDGILGFRLDQPSWPVRSGENSLEAPRSSARILGQSGQVTDAVVAGGCEIDRATVRHSVLFANVSVGEHSELSNAVVLPQAVIGRSCILTDVIVASGVRVPDGTVITPPRHASGPSIPTLISADLDADFNTDTRERNKHQRLRQWASSRGMAQTFDPPLGVSQTASDNRQCRWSCQCDAEAAIGSGLP